MAQGNRIQQRADRASTPDSVKEQIQATPQPSPHLLLQRAYADPSSLTPRDVKHLQRTIGNRATIDILSRHTGLQAKLKLGPAGDQYEQEADRVAQQVVRQMSAQPLRPQPVQRMDDEEELAQAKPFSYTSGDLQRKDEPRPKMVFTKPGEGTMRQPKPPAVTISRVQRAPKLTFAKSMFVRRQEEEEELQMKPLHGPEGGDVEQSVEQQIQTARGGGKPLDDSIRGSMEQGFGADFSGVRVHTGGQADALNRSLNAKAFTVGNDVFFGKGQYNPGSSSGKQLLAHELTHTMQQGAAGVQRVVIQRDIGFEFESQQMLTMKSNTGALPGAGFPSANAANTVFNANTTTRVPKGDALLSKPDVEVQADDSAMGGFSDLEIVTTHFPLDNPGRARLDQAMTDVAALANAYPALGNPAADIVPAAALNGVGGFQLDMNDGMFIGKLNIAQTAGQVTFGIRAGSIGDIVSDLHGNSTETNQEKTDRDPGRLRMRPSDPGNVNEPGQLTAGNEANTLVVGHTLAKNTLQQYTNLIPAAPGGPEMEGFLTIIFAYCESMQYKQSFLKNHTPLMAKTNLATLFTTLPNNVQQYYSLKRKGKSNLERLVAMAPGYAAKMNQPLFDGVTAGQENIGMAPRQWYHKLKLKQWLNGIVLRDRTLFEGIAAGFQGPKKRPGKDKLTNSGFPGKPRQAEVEGFGALGRRMDTDPLTNDPLPVFELRSATKMITYTQARQWALDLFDYIRSVNENPGGGHTLMT